MNENQPQNKPANPEQHKPGNPEQNKSGSPEQHKPAVETPAAAPKSGS